MFFTRYSRAMVAGPGAPRGRKPQTGAKNPQGGRSQKVIKVTTDGSLKVGSSKSAKHVATEVLSSLEDEALNDIIQELKRRPDKILQVARMVRREEYFTKTKSLCAKIWLHHTLVKLNGVGKGEWITILKQFRKTAGLAAWSDETIRTMDRAYSLQGVVNMVMYLGTLEMTDSVPIHCHYRPLLRNTMCNHLATQTAIAKDVRIDPNTGHVNFEMYKFSGAQNGRFMEITCPRFEVSVRLPSSVFVGEQDGAWSIERNWGFRTAYIKGDDYEKNIYDLFKKAGQTQKFDHCPRTWLDPVALAGYDNHRNDIEALLQDADEEIREELRTADQREEGE